MINKYTGGLARKTGVHNHVIGDGDDGDVSPVDFVLLCESAGMDAMAITGHDWYDNHTDAFSGSSVLWLPGNEFTTGTTSAGSGSHTTGVGIGIYEDDAAMQVDMPYAQTHQTIIDNIIAVGGFASIAHADLALNSSPVAYGTTLAETLTLTDYQGIEVAGPMCATHFYDEGSSYNDGTGGYDNIVDAVLAQDGFKVITSASDFHRNNQSGGNYDAARNYLTGDSCLYAGAAHWIALTDVVGVTPVEGDSWTASSEGRSVTVDQGFQIVYTDSLTVSDIVAGLKSGNSYASNGPLLSSSPSVSGAIISINSVDSCTCEWIDDSGASIQDDNPLTSFSFEMTTQKYIRAKLTRVSDGMAIWTQAFFSQVYPNSTANRIITDVESVPTETYRAYNGKAFSQDGINYYRGVENGDAVSVAAVGLTSY